jgi:hypothetical protein
MVNTCFPSGYGVSVIITVSRNYLPTWAAFYICSSFLNSSWLPWAEPLHMCCCSSLQRNTNIFCNISFETWNWYSPDSTWFICHCCSLCNLFNVVSCDLRITTSNLWILLAHYWVNVWSFTPKYNVNEKKKKGKMRYWGMIVVCYFSDKVVRETNRRSFHKRFDKMLNQFRQICEGRMFLLEAATSRKTTV